MNRTTFVTRAAAVAAAGLTLLCLTGCPIEPASDGSSGVVVKRETKEARNGPSYHVITVKIDGGKRDAGRVSEKTWKRCHVGDRWPDCKKGSTK